MYDVDCGSQVSCISCPYADTSYTDTVSIGSIEDIGHTGSIDSIGYIGKGVIGYGSPPIPPSGWTGENDIGSL